MKNLVVSWGGGINSTALLVGLFERGIRPEVILFADTGGENPSTYSYRSKVAEWLVGVGFPDIYTVVYNSKYGTLEQECLSKATLPAVAFGFKTCSYNWKQWPQRKFLRSYYVNQRGIAFNQITFAVGIDYGEQYRATRECNEDGTLLTYPLIEWKWDRSKCVDAIQRVGLSIPRKSACFFCPSTKKHEVLELKNNQPELYQRAIAMERLAMPGLVSIRGLGRYWSWEKLGQVDDDQLKLFDNTPELPCMCFDGSEE